MKNLAIWVGKPYDNDTLFDSRSPLDPDRRWAPFQELKKAVESLGGSCHTQDVFKQKKILPDAVLFLDIPAKPVKSLLRDWHEKVQKWVILQECEVIIPRNWDEALHRQFDKIFTWNTSWVDNKKYFKLNFSNALPDVIQGAFSKKEKLCVMVAGNNKAVHPLALYSKREEAIRWFEKNHPEDFDLYGRGWDEYVFSGPRLVRALNRIKYIKKLFAPRFPSYKGAVATKRPVLEKYKFCICYENARDIPGYITEKIFDCFFAGCVPVYWGAPDITDCIPKECLIDRREFKTHEDLHAFMKNLTDAEYSRRLSAINTYLSGNGPHRFSDTYFAETIAKVMADVKMFYPDHGKALEKNT